jgi:hypothetical protein
MYALHSITRDPRPLGLAQAAVTRALGSGHGQVPSRLQPAFAACNSERARPEASLDPRSGQSGHSWRHIA